MNEINKKSYFQGGGGENEPTPRKQKYKKEPLDPKDVMARKVFFQNYDLYDTGDPTPGTGYTHINEHDSVADFRKKKRSEKMRARRKNILQAILETHALTKKSEVNEIDDPEDDPEKEPILWNSADTVSSPIGLLDGTYPRADEEDKPVGNLYFGRIDTHRVASKSK